MEAADAKLSILGFFLAVPSSIAVVATATAAAVVVVMAAIAAGCRVVLPFSGLDGDLG